MDGRAGQSAHDIQKAKALSRRREHAPEPSAMFPIRFISRMPLESCQDACIADQPQR